MKPATTIFKFGGASVKDALAFSRVLQIIQAHASGPLVMVLSAMGKTTNALENISQLVFKKEDYREAWQRLIAFHEIIADDLHLQHNASFRNAFQSLCLEMEDYCHRLSGKDYPIIYGHIVHMGERMSTTIMHHYLIAHGIKSVLLDAKELIHCDMDYLEASVQWDTTTASVQHIIQPLLEDGHMVLTQGFVGAGTNGHPVTLGREGSDFTASILGSILDAVNVTIWKDVPGVLNADPKEFEGAVPYSHLPYSEAIELSYYGAKVIHPKTIKPLKEKNIPLFVKSFEDANAPGTLIQGEGEMIPPLPSVIRKRGQLLVSLFPHDLSFIEESSLSQIFQVLAKNGIKTDLTQNSALSFSFSTPNREGLTETLKNLFSRHYQVRYNDPTSLLTIRHPTNAVIEMHTKGLNIYLSQRTRQTYQAVVQDCVVIQ